MKLKEELLQASVRQDFFKRTSNKQNEHKFEILLVSNFDKKIMYTIRDIRLHYEPMKFIEPKGNLSFVTGYIEKDLIKRSVAFDSNEVKSIEIDFCLAFILEDKTNNHKYAISFRYDGQKWNVEESSYKSLK